MRCGHYTQDMDVLDHCNLKSQVYKHDAPETNYYYDIWINLCYLCLS